MAKATSFISNLNFEVIKREYLVLKKYIENEKDNIQKHPPLLLDENLGQEPFNGHSDDSIRHNRHDEKHLMSDINDSSVKNEEAIITREEKKINMIVTDNHLLVLKKIVRMILLDSREKKR